MQPLIETVRTMLVKVSAHQDICSDTKNLLHFTCHSYGPLSSLSQNGWQVK